MGAATLGGFVGLPRAERGSFNREALRLRGRCNVESVVWILLAVAEIAPPLVFAAALKKNVRGLPPPVLSGGLLAPGFPRSHRP